MTRKLLSVCLLVVISALSGMASNEFSVAKAVQLLDERGAAAQVAKLDAKFSPDSTAEAKQVNISNDVKFEKLISSKYVKGSWPVQVTAARKSAARKGGSLTGTAYAVEFDYALSTGAKTCPGSVTIVPYGSDSAYVYGIWGLTDTLKATYDLSAGTIKIFPGKVYNHSTYGPIWVCSINTVSKTYSTSTPVTGTIAADGTVTTSAWGVFVVSGTYAGGSFGTYSKGVFKQPNGQMKNVVFYKNATTTDSTSTFPVYIEQNYDNQIKVYNFIDNGTGVDINLNADSSIYIIPQKVYTHSLYGDFFCYNAKWSKNKVAQAGNITAKAAGSEIDFGNWGVFCRAYTSMRAIGFISSALTFNSGAITFPKTSSLSWTGEGTESSPYVITTPSQLSAFAQSVNGGTNYAGKFVALGNDINMSGATSVYTPIGTATAPFSGSFNGAGYKIKNVTFSTGEEDYTGVFGYADSTSTIKNVTVDSISLVSYGKDAGGLVGYSAGSISDVAVLHSSVANGNNHGGGVIGNYQGKSLTKAKFEGTVTGYGNTGGVVGTLQGKASFLESHGIVKLSGLINSMYRAVGGVTGSTFIFNRVRGSLTDSYSDATIISSYSTGYVGGVTGEALGADISRCFNAGPISATTTNPASSSSSSGACGGVTGLSYGGTFEDCYNANAVINSSVAQQVGGVAGYVMVPMITTDGNGVVLSIDYPSSFKNCFNAGQVAMTEVTATQGLYGKAYADSIFTNCYYDQQVTGNIPDSTSKAPMQTADLTSGKALNGFSTSTWTFTAGLYPRLNNFAETQAAYVGAAPLTLAAGETARQVKSTFDISTANSVNWKLYDSTSKSYVDETAGLAISGNKVTLKNVNSSEIIVARPSDNSLVKLYSLSTINPSAFEGKGTKDNPYLIKTKADLIRLDSCVTVYSQDFVGNYFKQTNDINMASDTITFNGIAKGGNLYIKFSGDYDGQNYAIHNLNINNYTADDTGKVVSKKVNCGVGLFGVTGAEACIHNLVIASDCSVKGFAQVGAFVGFDQGTIKNCKNYGKVIGFSSYVGGIAGYETEDGTVTDCYNAGTITTGLNDCGGIIGFSTGVVTNNQNDGDVRGDTINDFHAYYNQSYVAGIVGYNYAGVISGNVNTGNVFAPQTVGGIIGYIGNGGVTLSKNINYGTVEYTFNNGSKGAVSASVSGANATLAYNYFDNQIGFYGAAASASTSGTVGKLTKELTSGTPLDSLVADNYDWVAGQYPVLKTFKDETAAKAHRKMVVKFGDAETADDVQGNAAIFKASDLTWTVKKGKNFIVSDSILSVKLDADTTSLRDTLTAKVGDYTKVIALRALPAVFEGKGTKEDPFQIKTKEDMLKLAKFTNDELFPFTGRYFKVLNNIDFDSTAYKTVGIDAGKIDADFNGDGKLFTNINVTPATTTQDYLALFGNVGDHGCIHDVILSSGTINAYRYSAGIAGNVYGKVINCENHAKIATTKSIGAAGIAAKVKDGGLVKGCKNYGALAPSGNYAAGIAYEVEAGGVVDSCENDSAIVLTKAYIGGIVSENAGVVKNCTNNKEVSGTAVVGGIVACSEGGDSIAFCINNAPIVSTGASNGGILGSNTKSKDATNIYRCYNYGTVNGLGNTAGIAGKLYAGSILVECFNDGDITSTKGSYVAGIAGDQDGSTGYVSSMTRCYNSGTIVSNGNEAAGVVGDTDDEGTYTDCANWGDILSTGNFCGGFAGAMSGTALRCFNEGSVESSGYGVGGFSGIAAGSADQCFNTGKVTSTYAKTSLGSAGGFWGYGQPTITNCYNLGDVSGQHNTGGFIGGGFNGLNISNSYNAGGVVCPDSVTAGNFMPVTDRTFTFTNVYYDNNVDTLAASTTDAHVTALSTHNLVATNISDAFLVKTGMYPTLAEFANDDVANYYAATVVLADGETYDHVKSVFEIGTPEVTNWTSSENLVISGNKVTSKTTGPATVTKTLDLGPQIAGVDKRANKSFKLTRTYKLNLDAVTGINGINSDAAVVKSVYYNVKGICIGEACPTEDGIYIVTDYYNNGQKASRKIVVKNK
jgi:hypothetical protein